MMPFTFELNPALEIIGVAQSSVRQFAARSGKER